MSAPVNVLAWFDKMKPAIAQLFEITVKSGVTSLSDASEALEATGRCRAAVSELIEAARECMDCELDGMACIGSTAPAEDALGKLQAALARVGGAA